MSARILTELDVATICGAFAVGAGWALAGKLIDCPDPKYLKELVERDVDVADRVHAARDLADEQVVKSLFQRAIGSRDKPGDVNAIRFWLTNRKPEEWHDRREVTLAGDLEAATRRAAIEMGVDPDTVKELSLQVAEDAIRRGVQ